MTQPDYAGPRRQWTRPGFVAAAAFMVLVVVVALVVALTSSNQPRNSSGAIATPTRSANVAATVAGPGTDPTSGGPGLTAVPTLPPPNVTWQLFGQVALPVSVAAGPYQVTAGTATGYAHNPTGALLCTAQLVVRSGFSNGRAVWEPTITGQFVAGADRDRLLAAMRAETPQAAKPGELAQIAGFIYQSYSDDTAVIGLVLRAPGAANAFYVVTTTVQWHGGDWQMVAPPGGSWRSLTRTATDLIGVVEWGAV
jgi:hypothetical protein